MRLSILALLVVASGCRLDAKFMGGGDGAVDEDMAVGGEEDMAGATDDMNTTEPPDMSGAGTPSFDVLSLKSPVAEHEGFTVRVTAKSGSGAVLTSYAGTITMTSDWGDLTVLATPAFTNGVAEVGVMLNRETNPSNLAHVKVSDGTMLGQSSGISVTAVSWVQESTTPTIEPARSSTANWDYLLDNGGASLVYTTSFYMYYSGVSSNVYSIGRATSPDFNSWSFYPSSVGNPNPRIAKGSGWESSSVGGPAMVNDGGTFYMIYWGNDGSGAADLGLATSTDAINWTKYAGNPVFSGSDATCPNLQFHHLVVESAGKLRLLGRTNPTGQTTTSLCTSVSTDGGKTWTGTTKVNGFGAVGNINIPGSLVKEGSVFKTWFRTLSPTANYYATSSDGVNWTVSSSTQNVVPSAAAYYPAINKYVGFVDCSTPLTNASNAYCKAHLY